MPASAMSTTLTFQQPRGSEDVVAGSSNRPHQKTRIHPGEHDSMIRLFLSSLKIAPIVPLRERTPKSAMRATKSGDDYLEDEDRKVRFAPGTADNVMKPRPRRRRRVKMEAVLQLAEEQDQPKKKKQWRRFSWLAKLLSFFKRTRIEI